MQTRTIRIDANLDGKNMGAKNMGSEKALGWDSLEPFVPSAQTHLPRVQSGFDDRAQTGLKPFYGVTELEIPPSELQPSPVKSS